MKKRFTVIASAFAIFAGGSSLLSHPAYAAGNESSRDGCSGAEVFNIVNTVCENGGIITNFRQGSDGCSFNLACF